MFHWEIENEVGQLKKEGKLEEALAILVRSIDFAENEAATTQRRLYPNSFEEAALIYRKLKKYDDEVFVLERFLSNPKAISESRYIKIAERLKKACILSGKTEKRTVDDIEKIYYSPENILFEERHLFISNVLIVDVETTGFDASKNEILELAAILFSYNRVTNSSSEIKEKYVGLREPTKPIPTEATKVHGIKNKDVHGKSLDDAIIRRLFNQTDIFIAHNASFDRGFIKKVYPEVDKKDWYCSMNGISWKKYGHASKGLQKLITDYKIQVENSHRGLDDAMAVYYLLQQLNKSTQKTYLTELLGGFPITSEEDSKPTKSDPYVINVELSLEKRKKGFWETLLGK